MKNYGKLIPILLIFVIAVSWYKLIDNAAAVNNEYQRYIDEARIQADNGIVKLAVSAYKKALNVDNSVEVYVECANYLKNAEEIGYYENWCNDFLNAYPTEISAYEYSTNCYYTLNDYNRCFNLISTARKRGLSSDYLDSVADEIWYKYDVGYSSYSEISSFSNGYCAVCDGEKWGFISSSGSNSVRCIYYEVGSFCGNGPIAPVVDQNGEAFFIDTKNDKIKASKEVYKSFGVLSGGMIVGIKENGKYVVLDSDFNYISGEYDYASAVNGGVLAIRKGDTWQLVDTSGSAVSNETYKNVVVDTREIPIRNGRVVVQKSNGKYVILDTSFSQVGNLEFDEAFWFESSDPTAVLINGKWQYVNIDGALAFDNKTFDAARPFANGLAAVCVNGKWGYIDTNGNIAIEPQYEDAIEFSEKGSTFVKEGGTWHFLQLKRFN